MMKWKIVLLIKCPFFYLIPCTDSENDFCVVSEEVTTNKDKLVFYKELLKQGLP